MIKIYTFSCRFYGLAVLKYINEIFERFYYFRRYFPPLKTYFFFHLAPAIIFEGLYFLNSKEESRTDFTNMFHDIKTDLEKISF